MFYLIAIVMFFSSNFRNKFLPRYFCRNPNIQKWVEGAGDIFKLPYSIIYIDKCINFDGIATFHYHVLKIFYLHVFMHNISSIHNNATITRNKLLCWLKTIIVLENSSYWLCSCSSFCGNWRYRQSFLLHMCIKQPCIYF